MKKRINLLLLLLFVFPASGSYRLEGYSFGGGAVTNSDSENFKIQGRLGEISDNMSKGSGYDLGAGLTFLRQSPVPKAGTLSNPSNWYNKLKLVIDSSGAPSDTKFAIAISKDDFTTTEYVRYSDKSIGSSLTLTDYETFSNWGGASGLEIVGLDVGTSYAVKIRSMQSSFSESGWGPTAVSSTELPTLTFDIDVAEVDAESSAPYSINLGDLMPGVSVGTSKIWVDVDSNAASGVSVYIYGQNAGLLSVSSGSSIGSTTADLTSVTAGYGIQGDDLSYGGGSGPLGFDSPFNGINNVVGKVDTTISRLISSTNPVTAGRASVVIKTKVDGIQTSAANDYNEIVTIIASGNY